MGDAYKDYCENREEYEETAKRLRKEEAVYDEVSSERDRQDRKWGGRKHDDTHEPEDWERYIMKRIPVESKDDSAFRKRMIQIAALAVAAVQSFDRRHFSPGGKQ